MLKIEHLGIVVQIYVIYLFLFILLFFFIFTSGLGHPYHLEESICSFKGRFLEFRMYHKFANLVSKLLESTFYKEINKFQ